MSSNPPTKQSTNENHAVASGSSGIKAVPKNETKTVRNVSGIPYGSTAYGLFKLDTESRMKRTFPNNLLGTDFSKQCSLMWKDMSRVERQPYIDLVKDRKDPNAPKRPRTSYIFFCTERRPIVKLENPHFSASEVSKEMGRLWHSLDEGGKTKYQAMHLRDCERYDRELQVYHRANKVSNRPRVQEPTSSSTNTLQEFRRAERLPPTNEAPVEASRSRVKAVSKSAQIDRMTPYGITAYGLFKRELKSERETTAVGNFIWSDFSKQCSQLWKNMTWVEKKPYVDLAKDTKDPNAPKRPSTAYTLFFKQMVPILRARNPPLKGVEFAKVISREWNLLSEAEKEKYQEMNKKEREQYGKELTNYQKGSTASLNGRRVQGQPSSSKDSMQRFVTVDPPHLGHNTMNDQVMNIFSNDDGPRNIQQSKKAVRHFI